MTRKRYKVSGEKARYYQRPESLADRITTEEAKNLVRGMLDAKIEETSNFPHIHFFLDYIRALLGYREAHLKHEPTEEAIKDVDQCEKRAEEIGISEIQVMAVMRAIRDLAVNLDAVFRLQKQMQETKKRILEAEKEILEAEEGAATDGFYVLECA